MAGGYRLREVRRELGLSQDEMSSAVGISRQAYSAIELGSSSPRVSVAIAIAKVVGMSVEELFEAAPKAKEFDLRSEPVVVGEIAGSVVTRSLTELAQPYRMQSVDFIPGSETSLGSSVFLSGCDPILSLVADRINHLQRRYTFRWIQASNTRSEEERLSHRTHFSLVHGELGAPTSSGCVEFVLADWDLVLGFSPTLGEIPGTLSDVAERGWTFAMREPGSGVRDFVDRWCEDVGIGVKEAFPKVVMCQSHQDVASALRRGDAQAGLTMAWVGRRFGIRCVAVGSHQSRLRYSPNDIDEVVAEQLRSVSESAWFVGQLRSLVGYNPPSASWRTPFPSPVRMKTVESD